jgi:hypothetical protein
VTIPPILKNKWVLIGGGAVVLIALVMAGGSKSSGAVTVGGVAAPTDAQVSASRDITLAQLNAQVQGQAQQAQLAAVTQQGNIDLAKAGIDAQLNQYAIDAQTAIQSMQASTSRDVQLATLSSTERQQLAGINGQIAVAQMTLDQATNNAQLQANFQLQYAENANATQISLSQMQAQLVNNQLMANRDVTLAGLASQDYNAVINAGLQRDLGQMTTNIALANIAGNVQTAQINADSQLATTYSNNSTQTAIYASMTNAQVEQARIQATNQTEQARIASSTQKKSSSNGLIGSIIGGALSIFSDPRLKTDIVLLDRESDGLGIYRYNYTGDAREYIGVMADEVALIRPHALGPVIDGYATVNYTAL